MRKYVVTHKLGFLNWLLLPLHNFKIRIGITDKTKNVIVTVDDGIVKEVTK